MSSWPSPQKTSQMKLNLPALSGTNRILSTTPGFRSARRLKIRKLESVVPVFADQFQP